MSTGTLTIAMEIRLFAEQFINKYMKHYSNNFIDLQKLQKDKQVMVSKSNAEYFLLTCRMAEISPKFSSVNGKNCFTIK